jgi:hypothetical protein
VSDEQAIATRARVLAADYTPALWLARDERFLPPGVADRTVSLQEALEEIDAQERT